MSACLGQSGESLGRRTKHRVSGQGGVDRAPSPFKGGAACGGVSMKFW